MNKDVLQTGYTYKSGSLLSEFKTLLQNWKTDESIEKNFKKFESLDLFGKFTDSWNKEVLSHLRKRFFNNLGVDLKTLKKAINLFKDDKTINTLIYFHLGFSDKLFKAFLTDFLYPNYLSNKIFITTKDAITFIDQLSEKNSEIKYRSKETKRKVAGGLLSTCKDFGILEGHIKKKYIPIFIPDECLGYILYWLKNICHTPRELIEHFSWKFFFLKIDEVEQLLFKAHDLKFILYHQIGKIYRIDWLYNNLEEFLDQYDKEKDRSSKK